MTLDEAMARLDIVQEQLDQEQQENKRLHLQIGHLQQRLADAEAALATPAPRNERGAGRPKFNQEMQERLEQYMQMQADGYSQADIQRELNISRTTYYNYAKWSQEMKSM